MTDEPLLLTRCDASRNMYRFYALNVDADLFDGAALTRNWGRIGTKGRFCIQLFGSRLEAERQLALVLRRKLKRGYEPMTSKTNSERMSMAGERRASGEPSVT
ncbi:WGR domain-containing protein [Neorhizobium alkalisoli]|uniref:WGR domain-containing protein n=1 Tax=Neorhizobium alkalisoli TaxID=528178 RepID=UPI000CF9BA28|nr:WGR domain-containing protein [Neorhizobium alkalisoli]